MRLAIAALLVVAASGCASRSGYTVSASQGFRISYPEIVGDFPNDRAIVRYRSAGDLEASAKALAADRHLDTVAPSPAGGCLVVLVYLDEIRKYQHLEAIALQGGKVVGRERFAFKDTAINRHGSGFTAAAVLDLARPPTSAEPVTLDIVGVGLHGAPYRFTVEPAP